jgi:hypothetical protein
MAVTIERIQNAAKDFTAVWFDGVYERASIKPF